MKKRFFFVLLLFFCASVVRAANPEITVRYSDSPGLLRIVFEGMDDDFLKETKVYQSYSLLKIEFPAEFSIQQGKENDRFDVSKRGKSLFVNIVGLQNIKHFTLSDPPRLVIDASVKGGAKPALESRKKEAVEPSGISGRKIVLDPGHGGYDIGIVGSDYKEKEIALSLAGTVGYVLRKGNAEVASTRSSDRYFSIRERQETVYKENPDLFISLHVSSSQDFFIYYPNMDDVSDTAAQYELMYRQARFVQKSQLFAEAIAKALRKEMKRNVVVHRLPLSLLSGINAPAVLIETPDGKYFEYSQSDRAKIANGILKGIKEYGKE